MKIPNNDQQDSCIILTLPSSFCNRNAFIVRDGLYKYLENQTYNNVILDFYKTEEMDTTALAILVEAIRLFSAQDQGLYITNVSGNPQAWLSEINIMQMLPVIDASKLHPVA